MTRNITEIIKKPVKFRVISCLNFITRKPMASFQTNSSEVYPCGNSRQL